MLILEIIFMFVVGVIVLMITIVALVKSVMNRLQTPNHNIQVKMTDLEQRVKRLEHEQDI